MHLSLTLPVIIPGYFSNLLQYPHRQGTCRISKMVQDGRRGKLRNIPGLILDGEEELEEMPIGKYGMLRQTFLQEYHQGIFFCRIFICVSAIISRS